MLRRVGEGDAASLVTMFALIAFLCLCVAADNIAAKDINHSFLAANKGMIFRCKNRKVNMTNYLPNYYIMSHVFYFLSLRLGRK